MSNFRRLQTIFIFVLILLWIILKPQYVNAQDIKNMSVTATVSPRDIDYQLTVTDTPTENDVPQGTDILYTITYGSLLVTDTTPCSIEATLLPGRFQNVSIPSLYLADYTYGTGTKGYGNIDPVIDPITHTVTWTLPILPANTVNQSVSFYAKVNSAYTGQQEAFFDLRVRLITPSVTKEAYVSKGYIYREPPSSTTPTPTIIPSPTPIPLNINGVRIDSISQVSSIISFTTNHPTKAFLTYGTSITGTGNEVTSPTLSRYHSIDLNELTPDTTYYVHVFATDTTGSVVRSELIKIHTATQPAITGVDEGSLIVVSNDTILNPIMETQSGSQSAVLTIPVNTNYAFQIRVPQAPYIKSIQALMRNASVLGSFWDILNPTNTQEPDTSNQQIDMTEISPGTFTGNLKTTPTIGTYYMIARITDIYNNVTEDIISEIHVVAPFTVLWSNSTDPIENARIFLSRRNDLSNAYTPLPPMFSSIKNPSYTNAAGVSSFTLPYGEYRADVSYIGSETTVDFSINQSSDSGFPSVHLSHESASTLGLLRYYTQSFLDVFLYQTIIYVNALRASLRLFDLAAAISMAFLVILTILSFASRTYIKLTAMPKYVLHLIHSLLHTKYNTRYITGTVIDGDTRRPIALADITIVEAQSNTVVALLKTDRHGHYFFRMKRDGAYQIEILKRGYEMLAPVSYQPEYSPYHFIHVIHVTHPHHQSIVQAIAWTVSTAFGLLFEALLILSFVFELLFAQYFGLMKTLPYIAISLVNLLLWIAIMKHNREHVIE